MTTCIPFFFKPIKYNNLYYIDGGTLCTMSFLRGYPNYLGIHIRTDKETNIENMNFFEYITYFNNCLARSIISDSGTTLQTPSGGSNSLISASAFVLPLVRGRPVLGSLAM